jgi:hypothetical protein
MTTLIRYPEDLTGSYMIPDSVTSIGSNAFLSCSGLTSVTVPNSVTNIGSEAFVFCSGLTNVMLNSSVTSMGDYAFGFCSRLTSVMVPNSVTSIGQNSFAWCTSLSQAYFLGNAPTVDGQLGTTDSTVFSGATGRVYYVPGTTGWGSTFGGWPTVKWLPKLQQPAYSSSGTTGYGFNINWASGQTVVVEASTNLHNWTSVSTNTLVNSINYFSDSSYTNYPKRFYRGRSSAASAKGS